MGRVEGRSRRGGTRRASTRPLRLRHPGRQHQVGLPGHDQVGSPSSLAAIAGLLRLPGIHGGPPNRAAAVATLCRTARETTCGTQSNSATLPYTAPPRRDTRLEGQFFTACPSTGSCCQLHHVQHVQSPCRLAHLQPLQTLEESTLFLSPPQPDTAPPYRRDNPCRGSGT